MATSKTDKFLLSATLFFVGTSIFWIAAWKVNDMIMEKTLSPERMESMEKMINMQAKAKKIAKEETSDIPESTSSRIKTPQKRCLNSQAFKPETWGEILTQKSHIVVYYAADCVDLVFSDSNISFTMTTQKPTRSMSGVSQISIWNTNSTCLVTSSDDGCLSFINKNIGGVLSYTLNGHKIEINF